MQEGLAEIPGLLFVVATLLPIVSFGLLIVTAAIRWGLRPYAKDRAAANSVFQLLGGEVTGRGPAYVALAAIALAFVCSFSGFVLFQIDAREMHLIEAKLHPGKARGGHGHEGHATPDDKKAPPKKAPIAPLPKKAKAEDGKKDQEPAKDPNAKKDDAKEAAKELTPVQLRGHLNALKARWEDSVTWARLYPSPKSVPDVDSGTILTVGYRIDMLSAIMFVMVTFIATLIHLFSIGYMTEELQKTVEDHQIHTAHGHYERRGRFGRFFMYLSLFCFSMLNLILADNLFQIFVSWELVGICSYLLVGFYYERTSASNAANKAFITNRVGDAGFIIGLLIVWSYFGTLNFQEVFARIRCPEQDAKGAIKIDGAESAHKIVRADLQAIGDGSTASVKPAKTGEYALVFPRDPKQLQGPSALTTVYAMPSKENYGYIPYWLLTAAGLGIFLGCVGKSAQFPLQVWLPDAMEGPTPVSALIHAATMVAAGVYLVGRCHPLFTPEVLLTISYVGAITLFVAASVAVVMTDIKRVLAYSTVSQLGYMMLGLGVGGWTAGLLHLLTHAFFKALLFLGSGSVIYGCHHQQDMLKMGGLYPKMKITALTMLVGVLAIAGTPFFSGWYSKDEILAGAYGFAYTQPKHFLLFVLPLATAGITAFYMYRMWFLTFTGKPRDKHVFEHAHESPWMMTTPLILLAIMSVCVAWGWPLHEPGNSWVGQQLYDHSRPDSVRVDFERAEHFSHEGHGIVGMLALAAVILGLAFAVVLYLTNVLDPEDAKAQFPRVHRFLTHKWYFDEVYSALLVRPSLVIAHWCRNFDTIVIDGFVNLLAKWNVMLSRLSGRFDKGVIDGLVNLLADVSLSVGFWLRNVQTGYLRSYILFLALAGMALWVMLYAWAQASGP